jgi:hypothetical protein
MMCVPAFLVTGNPGSGKSTVAQELARRGLVTFDADYEAGLCYWEDEGARAVLWADVPSAPDGEWLRSHRWVWNRSRMEELLTQHEGPVFVCGIALNIDQFLDVFDRIFLLEIDEAAQEERLAAHDLLKPPGRNEAGRQQIRDGRPIFEAEMLRLGAIPVDGRGPTPEIADRLLTLLEE